MKRTLLMAIVAISVFTVLSYAQGAENKDDAERVENGRIVKIDAKKKILTLREDQSNPNTPAPSDNRGRRGGARGGRAGRGRRGGGVPLPGTGGERTPSSQTQGKEFKVTVTDKTSIKDEQGSISFDLLRVGDRLTIQGLPKGNNSDLEAKEITVNQ